VDYTYDGLGNRLLVRDDGTNTLYTVNNLNQYMQVGSTAYQYDADGNLTNKVAPEGTTSYGWSFDNKLVRSAGPEGVWQNLYDANGSLVRVNSDGAATEYVIDPSGIGNVVGEYPQGNSIPRLFSSMVMVVVASRVVGYIEPLWLRRDKKHQVNSPMRQLIWRTLTY